MIKNRWSEADAQPFSTCLEQRVYTSRLLGQDAELVMHGGGNTSAKDTRTNLFGKEENILYVKGSGWDLATIEKPGFPALKLTPLLELRKLDSLGDVEMMNQLRTLLVDSHSPDPSVETLLHAFLPHRFVDHTHADAILTLTNQPNGEKILREIFGKRVGIVPYVMPGFQLAKRCIEVFEENPNVEGIILLKHGIFSFGETAKESYDRMIRLVQEAESWIASHTKADTEVSAKESDIESKAAWMQAIRKQYLHRDFSAVLLLDESENALRFVNHPNVSQFSQKGPLTPDHVIRTKRLPLLFNPLSTSAELGPLFDVYEKEYRHYFVRNCEQKQVQPQCLDPLPRVLLLPGVGIITAGASYKDARIAQDIYAHTASSILQAQRLSEYEALPEGDIFDVEYWILEQAKLKLGPKKFPLSGKIALVTGGASGIGLSITKEFLEQGATVYVFDLQESHFENLEKSLTPHKKGGSALQYLKVDVTNRKDVSEKTMSLVGKTGGIDILVVNAGIFPPSSPIEKIKESDWKASIDVNVSGAFNVVAESLRWMKEQGRGGDIVFIVSKNVPAPGKEAGAYSVAKAAQAQLARVCALEAGAHGIRVNMLHPHLIFDTGIWSEEIIEKRATAYGMTKEQYKTNNLLKTSLTSQDVAKATFALVSGYFSKTTGAQIPVDGGSDRTL